MDIEDICDLGTGKKVSWHATNGKTSNTGVIELSRREDASIALNDKDDEGERYLLNALIRRDGEYVKRNALLGIPYLINLADPNWRVLVLWSKNPGEIKNLLEYRDRDPKSQKTLLEAWPVVYCVITMNGWCPDLEPGLCERVGTPEKYLEGLNSLVSLVGVDHIKLKIGDPVVKYRPKHSSFYQDTGKWENNIGGLLPVLKEAKKLGFRDFHFGLFDSRGRWDKIHQKSNNEFMKFGWTVDSQQDKFAVIYLANMASISKLDMVTCGASHMIGQRFLRGNIVVGKGICLDGNHLNRLLEKVGQPPLKIKGSTRPKGNRSCDCQDVTDIGMPVSRNAPPGSRQACHRCDYCFVSAKGGLKRSIGH